jgi:hypothetical protein
MYMTNRSLLVLTIALLVPACAFAVDGQVVINQSTVMAGGGFPYKITQPGSYKLSGNLNVPSPVDGIDISTDNVTLDLNGFTITGAGINVCTAAQQCNGIFSPNNNITLKNGTIQGFTNGVNLSGGGHSVADIKATTITSMGMLIGNPFVPPSVVVRCTAFNNSLGSSAGFRVFAVTMSDSAAGFNHIGIIATDSTLIHNVVSNNSAVGLMPTRSLFGSNTILGNTNDVVSDPLSHSQNNNLCTLGVC